MISYHPEVVDSSRAAHYTHGFRVADTNDIERLKKGIMGCVWSPIIWQDGYRKQVNFQRADWCVLDFDDGEMTLVEACQSFSDMVHIIGTTKSHQREKGGYICDRFRVCLLFDHPITDVHLYRWNMHKMMRIYPVDKSCKDGARFFYPCTEIISAADNGYLHDVHHDVDPKFERPMELSAYREAGILPPWVKATLSRTFPEGYRNNTCYRIAKDLTALGLSADKILDLIIHSPTYSGKASPSLLKEIKDAVHSAMLSKNRELDQVAGEF